MNSITNGNARRIVLLSAAILLATTLAGCTPVANGLFNEKPVAVEKTAAPTPTVAAVPLGGVLTKDAALTLRQDMPENGAYAYAMPDGTWVATNRFQLLPAAVVAIQQAKMAAVVKPSGSSTSDSRDGFTAARSFTGQYSYATGRQVAYISQQLQANINPDRPSNVMTWTVIGPGLSAKGQPSEAAAQKFAAQQIAAQSNPANWDILVKQ